MYELRPCSLTTATLLWIKIFPAVSSVIIFDVHKRLSKYYLADWWWKSVRPGAAVAEGDIVIIIMKICYTHSQCFNTESEVWSRSKLYEGDGEKLVFSFNQKESKDWLCCGYVVWKIVSIEYYILHFHYIVTNCGKNQNLCSSCCELDED